MTTRFPIKEIALQAGLGTATVDRVLNGRGGVRPETAERVRNALRDLEAQAGQLALVGQRFMVDLLVEAPQSFLDELEVALWTELPLMQPAVFRIRSDLRTRFPVAQLAHALQRAERLGSHGVILMAADAADLRARIAALEAADVPVVTLASDMPGSARSAYVGLDNARAGATAAWLISQRHDAGSAPPRVLVTLRNAGFRGEGERAEGFRLAMSGRHPGADISVMVEGRSGADFAARVATAAAGGCDALYSIGGGNRRLLAALAAAGVRVPLFVAHDLDADNRALMASGELDAILYHDLSEDIRTACRVILARASRGAMPAPPDGAVLRVMLPPMLDALREEKGALP